MSTATVCAPKTRAYWRARWPSPPMPKIATSCAGRAGHLHRLVRGDSRASEWRGVQRINLGRHPADEVCIGLGVFGVGAVDEVAGVELLFAQRLPAGQTGLAVAAGGAQPGHGDPVTLPQPGQLRDTRAEALNEPDSLVAGDQRKLRFDRPVAVGCVDVGVTQTRRLDLDDHLARTGFGLWYLLELKRLAEIVNDSDFHDCHDGSPHTLTSLTNWSSTSIVDHEAGEAQSMRIPSPESAAVGARGNAAAPLNQIGTPDRGRREAARGTTGDEAPPRPTTEPPLPVAEARLEEGATQIAPPGS
jgi:hypothetical protein